MMTQTWRRSSRAPGPLVLTLVMLIMGAVFTLVGAGLIIGSFFARSGASVSAYTQSHGVRETAIVRNVSVSTQVHCSGSTPGHRTYGSQSGQCFATYDARIRVALPRPVGGHATSVVHVARNVSYPRGQALGVLVDPKDPGYAELPGVPYTTQGEVLALEIVGGVLLVVGLVLIPFGVRRYRRR